MLCATGGGNAGKEKATGNDLFACVSKVHHDTSQYPNESASESFGKKFQKRQSKYMCVQWE